MHIFLIRADVEMRRIYTNLVITSMTNNHTFWNHAVISHCSSNMSPNICVSIAEDSIAAAESRFPFSTACGCWWPNLLHESLYETLFTPIYSFRHISAPLP